MNYFLLVLLLVVTSGFDIADEGRTGKSLSLHIRTVDENNRAFEVQMVRWWHAEKVDAIHQLECKRSPCSEWILEEEISGSIVVEAAASIVTKDDASCWDVYAGARVVDMPAQEATIIIVQGNMVCK